MIVPLSFPLPPLSSEPAEERPELLPAPEETAAPDEPDEPEPTEPDEPAGP